MCFDLVFIPAPIEQHGFIVTKLQNNINKVGFCIIYPFLSAKEKKVTYLVFEFPLGIIGISVGEIYDMSIYLIYLLILIGQTINISR